MLYDTVTPTGALAPTDLRWWIKDLPEDKLAAMPELPGFYLAESGNFETMSRHVCFHVAESGTKNVFHEPLADQAPTAIWFIEYKY